MTALIPDDYLKAICRIGDGAATCRYIARELAFDAPYECVKHVPAFKEQIDRRHLAGTMVARSDNCDGLRDEPDVR